MSSKKLYLHIGLGKTGSSALQYWLSLNHEHLEKLGFSYADLIKKAKTGAITSGNGVALQRAFSDEDEAEVRRLIDEVYFNGFSKAIISSETLQKLTKDNMELICRICEEQNIELKVIAFARSAYEWCYSAYLQGVKRHGFTHRYGEKPLSYRNPVQILKRYADGFGDRFFVINYDLHKKNILSTFLEAFDVPLKGLSLDLAKKVNRSLTFEEANVLVAMNALHKGAFSTEISDYLIMRSPEVETQVFYTPENLEALKKNSEEDVDWVNETFFKEHPEEQLTFILDKTIQHAQQKEDAFAISKETVGIVVEWCFQYMTSDKPHKRVQMFTNFVRDLAVYCEPIDLKWSYDLMKLALELRPEGPFIQNKFKEYELQVKPVKRYLDSILRIFR